jgi:hypothetical protein
MVMWGVEIMPVVNGRTHDYELRKFEVLDENGLVIREQLGLAGVQVGEIIRNTEDGTTWKVESLPEANMNGVLGVQASIVEIRFNCPIRLSGI